MSPPIKVRFWMLRPPAKEIPPPLPRLVAFSVAAIPMPPLNSTDPELVAVDSCVVKTCSWVSLRINLLSIPSGAIRMVLLEMVSMNRRSLVFPLTVKVLELESSKKLPPRICCLKMDTPPLTVRAPPLVVLVESVELFILIPPLDTIEALIALVLGVV